MLKELDLLGIEAAWRDGDFNDAEDAVRHAQRTIPDLIAELRASRKVVEAAREVIETTGDVWRLDFREMVPVRVVHLHELAEALQTINAISTEGK